MNKSELVDHIALKTGLKKKESEKALEACLEAVEASLASGDDVRLLGFGTFTVRQREESKGRNPKTGEPITIPAAKIVKFVPGKQLKEAVMS